MFWHDGIELHHTRQVVELILCYICLEKCDLDMTSGRFVVSLALAPGNISPDFETLIAKLEAQDKLMPDLTAESQASTVANVQPRYEPPALTWEKHRCLGGTRKNAPPWTSHLK